MNAPFGLEIGEVGAGAALLALAGALFGRGARRERAEDEARAMAAQTETIAALESRLSVLENEGRAKDAAIEELRQEVRSLRQERSADQRAWVLFVEAVAAAGICANAPGCPKRRVPAAA